MSKGILEFNLEDRWEENAFRRALNATQVYCALADIQNNIFRPARKHGYPSGDVADALKDLPEETIEKIYEVIGLLENQYHRYLEDYSVDMNHLE